ncbi:MAG: hypothetical protein J6Q38_00125 [Clostridia bacterium]|nr:hypothetical protein [Clostridia bacterium]
MKKLIVSIICVIMAAFMLIGCGESTTPLSDVAGNVLSGNGSFAVEKGNYVYFVNGQEPVTASNEFGKVQKGALVRVKTSELANPKTAKIETVIPKLFISASYKTGVYMYGDYVYYATPSNRKDKQSNVLNNQTQFYRFNLKTGKADDYITIAEDNTTEYRFIEKDGTVYLAYVMTEEHSEDEHSTESHSHKVLTVYNADTRKKVMESFKYEEMLMPEDDSSVFYLTKFGYDEVNESNEAYHEIYKYTIGDTEAKLVLSGSPDSLTLLQGAKFTLIKNTGNYLFYKQSGIDTTNSSVKYFAMPSSDSENPVLLGGSNKYIDAVITSGMYVKSLTEIYYMDTTTELGGFAKFDYTKVNGAVVGDMTNGRTPVCKDVSGYNLQFVQNDYAYFSNSEGNYYRCGLNGENYSQINGVAMKSPSDWYMPRVIGNYFIGSYADTLYGSYVYVIDITNINDEEAYKEYLEDVVVEDEEHVLALADTRLGIITSADETAFNESVEEKFDDED